MALLETIQSPKDIKPYTPAQRLELAKEIRETILETVSKTGGHLSASLGAVELTIAVHTVFDAPVDQIVWDTGHQGYAHKLLTGRFGRFSTLRQWGGISGFLKRAESEFDAFGAGHAATSISAATGMALARDIQKHQEKVVCIIGDSSIPNGMAFEALNHLGHSRPDLLLILNDNEMAISPPVGAVSKYLNRIITDKKYNQARLEIDRFLKKLPGAIGQHAPKIARHAEEMVKSLVSPGMLFEEMGFNYIGPVDGHDTEALIEILRRIQNIKGPVLLHAITRKGKGFLPAEKNPVGFHGAGRFDLKTGEVTKSSAPVRLSWSQAFADELLRAARQDPRVTIVTPAMIAGSRLEGFLKEVPERLFDVGIAEEHGVTMAAGMAARGLKPVVCIYSTFFQRAFDQTVHDVAMQNLPVVFALDRAGLVGDDGPTHHGVLDIPFLRGVPNMVLMAPSTAGEMARMLDLALTLDGPSAIRFPRGSVPAEPEAQAPPLELGKAWVRQEGQDACLLAYGNTVEDALEAAARLRAGGISVKVVDARFAKPLDRQLILQCARACPVMVTVEEGNLAGGFGSAVLEVLGEAGCVPFKFARLGVPDEFVEQGSQARLKELCSLDAASIASKVKALLKP